MRAAMAAAAPARLATSPRPWVGAAVGGAGGPTGATDGQAGPHAEVVALGRAGGAARGATLYVTLEPCSHWGRTPPCVDAVLASGVRRVVVGTVDPDTKVAGQGIAALRAAGLEVEVGVCRAEVEAQLAPYLHHRRTGRPYVVLKLAASLDGRTAAPDASSRWITGPEARADAHLLRASSDAVLVGAGTVRADDPALTVRDLPAHVAGWPRRPGPLRVVLGRAPESAAVRPCLELDGPLPGVLDELGRRDVVQVLVEGGATVAAAFHRERLVDRYVVYLAPALFGGDDGAPVFRGPGAASISEVWRGRVVAVERLGGDLRVELAPRPT
ncbi:MAG: bifunctional diaminohydroxyphosphoribosylaminopyrimidine deaminase/5-amino-6-(5-phosphoribosylamino)uracil reductase RibD [Acidimicrobiia bacterium]|nr:bifunctional diaminohydroxyphosphoribosylaminopyrimidine deaminase/5-amino-6-(5-phosphoribosylamino)uracil reductase RibD [Acidimicrobiia bacterium]